MITDVIPVLRVADAAVAAAWYARLGFAVTFEHRYAADYPAYVGIRREGAQIHLSEHTGDARPDTLVYLWVDDIDPITSEFGVVVEEAPWAMEVELTDPDGNRVRLGQALPEPGIARILGDDVEATLVELERAMWDDSTRGDRDWMDRHLSPTFTEHGRSGRRYTRAEILDQAVGPIDVELEDVAVRALGRDAALVTYRSIEPRGPGNRASVWVRRDGRWLLDAHQGVSTDD